MISEFIVHCCPEMTITMKMMRKNREVHLLTSFINFYISYFLLQLLWCQDKNTLGVNSQRKPVSGLRGSETQKLVNLLHPGPGSENLVTCADNRIVKNKNAFQVK